MEGATNDLQESDNHQSLELTFEQDLIPRSVHETGAPVDMLSEAETNRIATCLIHETETDLGAPDSLDSPRERGMVTPTQPSSPIYSPTTSEDMDYLFHTPPPQPAFSQPPSPPRPEPRRPLFGNIFSPEFGQRSAVEHRSLGESFLSREYPLCLPSPSDPQQGIRQPMFLTGTYSTNSNRHLYPFEGEPRKPLTSIEGSNRCLWPPDSTFLTMSNTFKERAFQHRRIKQEGFSNEDTSFQPVVSTALSLPTLGGTGVASSDGFTCSQKNHVRCKNSGDCMQELQPRRKARRVMDGGPYFKERNHRLVAGHVRKLIQEAVEDGVGELDLSNLELTDLPSEICDLNFAIVYNERGSFSLSNNRLKLFLSSNMFSTVPMDVFALHNLSVLSLRNNSIEAIPPEIGLLHNLVELSIGGNLLKVLPSQIILLPKLHILTVHPNPFLTIPEPGVGSNNNLGLANHNEPPAFNGAHNGINAMAPEASEEHNMTNHNGQIQLQASLISPPVSPPTSQSEDVDMMPPPEQDGIDSGSPSSTILRPETTISDVASEQTQRTGEPSSSQSYSFTSSISMGEPSSQHTAVSSVTSEASIGENLPHLTTRSRFPTLLVLAGNALLNYMESQSASAAAKKGGQGVERPRKDSKISMGGDEWVGISPIDGNGHYQQEQWSETQGVVDHRGGSPLASRPSKKRYVFKEDVIKSHLTPYLYDNFKRARTNNLCAGCQKRFWKPCRIVVVWQDILGQSSVPVEWRGCGIRGCPGVPASMRSSPLPALTPPEPSSPASNSMSIVTSPSGSGSSSHSTSST